MNTPKPFTMVPIQRTDVFQTLIAKINQLIEEAMHPGDRLPSERELADSLGVSRTSIRQVLKVLESAGKLETRVGSGTYITQKGPLNEIPLARRFTDTAIDKAFISQLIVARIAIETAVFTDSFDKITAAHTEELAALLQENANELASKSHSEEEGMDLSFESKVAAFGQNQILMNMQQQIHHLWMQSWQKFGHVPDQRSILHQEHLDILAAIKRKDKLQTIALITRHVDREIEPS